MEFLFKNTEYWFTKDDWHEMFAKFFLSEARLWPAWLIHEVTRSTADLDTIELTEYIEKILIFCETELQVPRKFLLPPLKWLDPPF